jgi:hypothetical protein
MVMQSKGPDDLEFQITMIVINKKWTEGESHMGYSYKV